jgi:MFS superfamily sulfate permease-like transporter
VNRRIPVLEGILPLDRKRVPVDVIAGITLAALAIPEVMGYTKIAGMPVITGLYTILLPITVFALLGSSRHLVVGADSATAAIMFAGLAGLATPDSTEWVALAGWLAILAAGFLMAARILKLGFLADFLSSTVLIGFLTGVGVQVACGQVAGMLGVPKTGSGAIMQAFNAIKDIPQASGWTVVVSASVLIVIVGSKYLSKKIPGALIAVIGAIAASAYFGLAALGVSTLGTIPSGLPHFGVPALPPSTA